MHKKAEQYLEQHSYTVRQVLWDKQFYEERIAKLINSNDLIDVGMTMAYVIAARSNKQILNSILRNKKDLPSGNLERSVI